MKTIVVTRRENVKDEDKMRLDIDPTTQRIVTSNEDIRSTAQWPLSDIANGSLVLGSNLCASLS
mgnify:CR=1 FL=1